MKGRFFLTIVGLWLGMVSMTHAEPKAYELVKFHGKVGTVTVALDYADGYYEATELRTIQGGKTTKYNIDGSGNGTMTFAPAKGGEKKVVVQIDTEQIAPAKVTATYTSGGKSTSFTMTRSK